MVGLVIMVDAVGEGPNRPGAKLAVDCAGQRIGTVGGGASEYALVEAAKTALSNNTPPTTQIISMSHKENAGADASGMICAGTQTFALVCLTPKDLPTISKIVSTSANNNGGIMKLTPNGLSFRDSAEAPPPRWSKQADSWTYEEPIGKQITITMIGGGHVSLALTPLLKSLGMRVVVLDNRSALSTMEANTMADEKRVISYEKIRDHIPTGDHSYACIMTFAHKHDKLVLEQLAEYPLGYLGMMGSKPKIKEIMQQLREQGIAASALNAVHAPIGIPIGSNTPEEIAISIAAQLIATTHL